MIKILEQFNSLEFNDKLTAGLAVLSIVVSIITLIRTNKINKKIADSANELSEKIADSANELNKKVAEKGLNKQFFEEIFFKDIVERLPKSLDTLEETSDIIYVILEKAKFYKYFEKDFYESIKKELIEIDDILVTIEGRDREIFETKKNEIMVKIEIFYGKLRKYYLEI